MISIINSLLILFFSLVSISVWAYTPGKVYKITVLHTNDHHGAFWKNEKDEYGMAARSTLIEKLRTELKDQGSHVLLLDGGDVNTGTPESELADAAPDFLGMSYMKYDAMAVGNHEFDKPFEVLLRQQKEWANFPFLSANIYDKKTGKRFFDSHKVMNLDDLKVTIFGLTTEQTPQQSIRFPQDKLEIRPTVEEAQKLVPSLKKNSDLIIAVTHMGHYPNEQHGSRAPGDVTLARRVNGINLIVGGHTQLPLFTADIQNDTIIVQAGEWGKHLGRVDLEFKDGKTKLIKYELIPVNYGTSGINEDSNLLEILRPYKAQAEIVTSKVVGHLIGKFEGHRSFIRKQETNLGNFVTYLMALSTNSEIAVTDSGVIRTSLEEGDITYGDILSVHPSAFSLKYASVELTGTELWNYLEKVSVLTDGAYPQFYGIKIVLNKNQLLDVQIQNTQNHVFQPLERNKKYKLAITDFIAAGGDGYPRLNQHISYKEQKLTDAEIMRAYFEEHKVINASEFAPVGNMTVIDN